MHKNPETKNKKSNENYTPRELVKLIRHVIGDIELDPASSLMANLQVGVVDNA